MAHSQQLCTLTLDGLLFGIDVQQVQEVICQQQWTPVPLAAPVVRGLINLRGQIVTAIDLRRRLELADRPENETPVHVVVRTDDGPMSLLVDRIGDVVNVESESFEPLPATVTGMVRELVLGAYQLRKSLLLLLDIKKIVEVEELSLTN